MGKCAHNITVRVGSASLMNTVESIKMEVHWI